MTGGSFHHSLISTNTTTALSIALRDTPCIVLNSDIKLYIDAIDSFFYPDAMVLCEAGETSKHSVRLPQIIIEVLSPSTEDYDHSQLLTPKGASSQKLSPSELRYSCHGTSGCTLKSCPLPLNSKQSCQS